MHVSFNDLLRNDMQKAIIAKLNIADFYWVVEKYDLAFVVYQQIEGLLESNSKNKFTKESEKRLLNPVKPESVRASFFRELQTNQITMLKAKQWLLWEKLRCLGRLKEPNVAAAVCESYLDFLIDHLVHSGTLKIRRVLMMLQTHHFVRSQLLNIVTEFNPASISATVVKLLSSERVYLRQALNRLYSMGSQTYADQYELTLILLKKLSDSGDINSFKEHIKSVCPVRESTQFSKELQEMKVAEVRETLQSLPLLLEHDARMCELIANYSRRRSAERCFGIKELLFLRTKEKEEMKEVFAGRCEIEKWSAVFEYAQTQSLLMNILRDNAELSFKLTMEMAINYLSVKNIDKAQIFWSIALIFCHKIKPQKIDATKLFTISNGSQQLILQNPFNSFSISSIYLKDQGITITPKEEVKEIHPDTNSFSFIWCKPLINIELHLEVGSITFTIALPNEITAALVKRVKFDLSYPSGLKAANNLFVLKVMPSYHLENSILSIDIGTVGKIGKGMQVCRVKEELVNCEEAVVDCEETKHILMLAPIKGPEETVYISFEIDFFEHKPKPLRLLVSLKEENNHEVNNKDLERIFMLSLLPNLGIVQHIAHTEDLCIIQFRVKPLQSIQIVDVKLFLTDPVLQRGNSKLRK